MSILAAIDRLIDAVNSTDIDSECQSRCVNALEHERDFLNDYAIRFSYQFAESVPHYGATMRYACDVWIRQHRKREMVGTSCTSMRDAVLGALETWRAFEANLIALDEAYERRRAELAERDAQEALRRMRERFV